MELKFKEMVEGQIARATEELAAAKALLRNGFFDDAISRVYYSMFHAASAVLLSEGITVEGHSGLKTMFGLHFIKTGKIDRKYGRSLSKLKMKEKMAIMTFLSHSKKKMQTRQLKMQKIFFRQ